MTLWSFVRYCGQGSSLLWTPAQLTLLVQCASPGRRGELVGMCDVCMRRVGWRRASVGVNSLSGIFIACPICLVLYCCPDILWIAWTIMIKLTGNILSSTYWWPDQIHEVKGQGHSRLSYVVVKHPCWHWGIKVHFQSVKVLLRDCFVRL